MSSAIHCRNVLSHTYGASNRVPFISLFMLREFFTIGKWQELENDGAAGWSSASNILLSPSDLAVSAGSDLVVTSAIGGFTSSMESEMLSLYASNDENRGVYNIRAVIDSNTLIIDSRCRGASWTTETGMSGKIHNGGRGVLLLTSSYVVFRAPSATGRPLELHFSSPSTTQISFQGYVKGDWYNPPGTPPTPGARTTAGAYLVVPASTDQSNRWNVFFSDVADPLSVQVWGWSPGNNEWFNFIGGELDDVATGDNYPGFYRGAHTDSEKWLYESSGSKMLNEADTPTTFLCTYNKRGKNLIYSSRREILDLTKTLNKGQYKVYRPAVVGEDTANGGFVRGTAPYYCAHRLTENYITYGNFWKIGEACIPKNGSTDPRIIASTTW